MPDLSLPDIPWIKEQVTELYVGDGIVQACDFPDYPLLEIVTI